MRGPAAGDPDPVDVRRLPVPEAIRWLAEHGEPPEQRPDVDTESLRRRFPRLAGVRVADATVEAPSGQIPVRVYTPPQPSGPALVWVHGGGFIGGYLDMPESNWVAMELGARGIRVLAVDYTKCLGGTHYPVPSDDVLAAWRAAPSLLGADDLGTADLMLGGASAGGNLTAGVVARLRDAGQAVPAGLVLVYPALHPDGAHPGEHPGENDPHAQLSLNFAGSAEAMADPHVFPGLGRTDGFPPTLVVVCEEDGLRPSGEAFAASLGAAGVPVDLRVEAGAEHGHLNEPADPAASRSLAAIAGWIRR